MVEQFPKLEKTPEELDLEIQALWNNLEDKFGAEFENLNDEWQDRWYYIEMEVKVSKNRQEAKNNLIKFTDDLNKFLENV
jgi:hypothetical protein